MFFDKIHGNWIKTGSLRESYYDRFFNYVHDDSAPVGCGTIPPYFGTGHTLTGHEYNTANHYSGCLNVKF